MNYSLDAILALCGASSGSLFLWDERLKEFVLTAVRGRFCDDLAEVRVKLQDGILGWVGEKGHPVLVKDLAQDTRFQGIHRHARYRTASFISIPLVAKNKLLGVVNATERGDLKPFSEEDLERAQSFCHQAATAYENLRMASRSKKQNEELLEQLSQIRQVNDTEDALISIGKLASHLAHELNNPLDAIRRYVNLALEQSLADSLTHEYLLKAKRGIRNAIRVIRNIVQFSSAAHKSNARPIELHQLVEQSLETVTHDPSFQNIQIKRKFSAGPSMILDRGLLIVLYNLYRNAQRAMNGHGTLTVLTQRVNGKALLIVEDTGCGIPKTIESRLFDPFFSTKEKGEGIGIGLAICREIVERCGGQIQCTSVVGQGARFLITLPCYDEKTI